MARSFAIGAVVRHKTLARKYPDLTTARITNVWSADEDDEPFYRMRLVSDGTVVGFYQRDLEAV